MKTRFLTLSLLIVCSLCSYAQMGKMYNADKQLSSSFINQIYQDHNGFIWIATRDGLNKYDGYQFVLY